MEGGDGEGATEFHDYEGGGIGEGQGLKDVSDKIENEEQVRVSHCSWNSLDVMDTAFPVMKMSYSNVVMEKVFPVMEFDHFCMYR